MLAQAATRGRKRQRTMQNQMLLPQMMPGMMVPGMMNMGMQPMHPTMGMQPMAMQPGMMMHPGMNPQLNQLMQSMQGMMQQQPAQALEAEAGDVEEEIDDEQPPVPIAPAAPPPPPPQPVARAPALDEGVYNLSDDARISTSSSLLKGIGRKRLTNAISILEPSLDAGYLSELTQKGLLQILWLMTRLKPTIRIAHLSHLFASHYCFFGVLLVFVFLGAYSA